jgi:hypothetical protein
MLKYIQLIRAEYIVLKEISMRKVKVLVIAGYGCDVDEIPTHREFVIESAKFGAQMGSNLIFAVGGTTNPNFPDRTEAEATARVLLESSRPWPAPQLVILKTGDTSADTLQAVKEYLEKFDYEIDELILTAEMSRSTGFEMDGLYVGLKEMTKGKRFFSLGWRLPETDEEFRNQKKKLFLKLLSHRYKFFHWFRYVYQKRHQRKWQKSKEN